MNEDKEYNNIRRLQGIHKEIDQLSSLIESYEKYERDATEVKQTLENYKTELEDLRAILANPKEVPSTESRFHNLIHQIQIIHDKLVLDRYGNGIDRNHCLILENHVYDNILRDIESSIMYYYRGVSIPTYYYILNSDFDFNPVKDLLSEIISELKKLPDVPNNFIQLFNIQNDIKERIIGVAIAEYQQNRKPENRYN